MKRTERPKIKPCCSLQTVADAAGCSRMTVSLALRDRPGLPAATSERVKNVAKKLGYRANPLVSIYQAHVRARRVPRYQANLAWINDHPLGDIWQSTPWMVGYWEGASERAQALGFKLEQLHLSAMGATPEQAVGRAKRILGSRGIYGVVLPWLHNTEHASLDWSDFAVAMIGKNVSYRDNAERKTVLSFFHHSNSDVAYNLKLAWHRLHARGFQRIGLALDHLNDRLGESLQRGCFLIEQEIVPRRDRVPPLVVRHFSELLGQRELVRWFLRHQPDAVMLFDTNVVKIVNAQTGFASKPFPVELSLTPNMPEFHGIDAQHELIGASAIDLVVAQLHNNERGRPDAPREVLVKGVWREPVSGLSKPKAADRSHTAVS